MLMLPAILTMLVLSPEWTTDMAVCLDMVPLVTEDMLDMVDTPDMVVMSDTLDMLDIILARGLRILMLTPSPTQLLRLPMVFPYTMLMPPDIPTMLVLSQEFPMDTVTDTDMLDMPDMVDTLDMLDMDMLVLDTDMLDMPDMVDTLDMLVLDMDMDTLVLDTDGESKFVKNVQVLHYL